MQSLSSPSQQHPSLRPTGYRLLVEVQPQLEDKLYASLIHLPDNRLPSFTDLSKSVVVRVSDKLGCQFAEGDIVLHNNQMGTKIPGFPQHLLLYAEDIIARVEEGKE